MTGGACWAIVGVGAGAGLLLGVPLTALATEFVDNLPSRFTMLALRPLEPGELNDLGCQYSFAKRG